MTDQAGLPRDLVIRSWSSLLNLLLVVEALLEMRILRVLSLEEVVTVHIEQRGLNSALIRVVKLTSLRL